MFEMHVFEAGGSLRLLDADQVNPGFSETATSLFCKPTGDWDFFVDDVPLPSARHENREVWVWTPGFFAGSVRAELVGKVNKTKIDYVLDVSPDPGKLGQAEFVELVKQVWSFDPSLVIGEEASTHRVGAAGFLEDPAVRYMRISRYGPSLQSALGRVTREPVRSLHFARSNVPWHKARSADLQTVRAAMVRDTVAVIVGSEDFDASDRANQPLFDVPISETSYDCAANRTLAALLVLVTRAIDDLLEKLQAQMSRPEWDEGAAAAAKRWPRRSELLAEMRRVVASSLRVAPLASVTRREITAAGLTAIASHPAYARAQNMIWKMLRVGYEGAWSDELSAMSPTWGIYESWCFTRIRACLAARFPSAEWKKSRPGDGRWVIHGREGDRNVSLYFQQPFGYSSTVPDNGLWSVSARLIPDIVLVMQRAEKTAWGIFDAKYRRGRQNVLDGMRSAHLYRDALRFQSAPPNLSSILIPAPAENASWLHAPEYRAQHGVGAIVCSLKNFDEAFVEELESSL
jgi:PD-(D/E)XK nuclease superfamily protein